VMHSQMLSTWKVAVMNLTQMEFCSAPTIRLTPVDTAERSMFVVSLSKQ
jgi:hypothetical protein